MDKEVIVAYTTVANETDAICLADKILEKSLAACIQIDKNVFSIYKWKGKIEKSIECRLCIKSNRESLSHLEAFVKEEHPYETPEWIYHGLGSSEEYGNWICENVTS